MTSPEPARTPLAERLSPVPGPSGINLRPREGKNDVEGKSKGGKPPKGGGAPAAAVVVGGAAAVTTQRKGGKKQGQGAKGLEGLGRALTGRSDFAELLRMAWVRRTAFHKEQGTSGFSVKGIQPTIPDGERLLGLQATASTAQPLLVDAVVVLSTQGLER